MISHETFVTETGEEIFPLQMGYLPDSFLQKAEDELNYTLKVRAKTLQELKELMADDNTMKSVKVPDEALLRFLNSRKYDVRKTLKQLKKYIAFRKKNTDMFDNINFENVLPILEVITPLPWRCQDGCTIILIDLEKWKYDRHLLEALKQMFLISFVMGTVEPMAQVNGFKFIFNLNVSPDILKLGTPYNLYLLYYGSQQILPARTKAVHFINMGVIGRTLLQMARIFLPEKLKKRLHIHPTTDRLLNHFPKAVVPKKFGGDLIDYDMTNWLKKHTSPEELSILDVE